MSLIQRKIKLNHNTSKVTCILNINSMQLLFLGQSKYEKRQKPFRYVLECIGIIGVQVYSSLLRSTKLTIPFCTKI